MKFSLSARVPPGFPPAPGIYPPPPVRRSGKTTAIVVTEAKMGEHREPVEGCWLISFIIRN